MIRISLLISLLLISSLEVQATKKQDLRDTGLVCAVDMGSNSFKFLITEIKQGKYFEYLDDRRTAGVGDDLNASEKKSGRKIISAGKLSQIRALLAGFQDLCEQKTQSRKIYAIATAAFREAENGKVLSDQLLQQGVELKILTAEMESVYAYEAATLGEPGLAVVDLGSRTTEFVSKPDAAYQWSEIHTGYKVAWDDFYDHAGTFSRASEEHLKKLSELIGEKEISILRGRPELVLIEVGEMVSYILGIPQKDIEGRVITRAEVQKEINRLSVMEPASFSELKKNFENAAKVLPRLVLTDFILAKTGYEQFRGTNRELNIAIVYRIARRTP
jgi:hypothetical protein